MPNQRRANVEMVSAPMDRDFAAELTAEAARRGVSRSEAIRQAVADWLARQDTEAVPA
jgi:metal-responsive CopG/Arc/MetJ family transcriptional regulator